MLKNNVIKTNKKKLSFLHRPHGVVVDEDVFLVFGAGDGLLLSLQHGPVARVLHVVLGLRQEKLPRRCVQVLLTSILMRQRKSRSDKKFYFSLYILK